MATNLSKFDFGYFILTSFRSFLIITADNINNNSFYQFKCQLYYFNSFLIKIKNSYSKIILKRIIPLPAGLNLSNIINKSCIFIVFEELGFELWNVINEFVKLRRLNILLFVSRKVIIDKQNLDMLSICTNNSLLKLYLIQQLKQSLSRSISGLKQAASSFYTTLKLKTNYK
ncbi:50S ribosomal protein L10 [Candidatus Hodgkinia cicadicola]|uniref:50S ribosomal protein L10 n=1 Tax=Candidatus Hodgkinia cicadicola TaxID=573658 RepID=A0ABX4MHC0_9HYPH|nr:50S ribosomal protein L10 [Candidatus Hodgkinia cicadicola]